MPRKPKLAVQDLILEVTRRCNMKCPHCLRGDRENLNMSSMLLKNILSKISEINCLTFTGGEPSIALEQLRDAYRLITQTYKIPVTQVYIVTNGKVVSDEFLSICRKWHMYCLQSEYAYAISQDMYTGGAQAYELVKAQAGNTEDRTVPGLTISLSMDKYHEDIEWSNLIKLMTLPNVSTDKYNADNDDRWIIKAGNAAWNGLGDEPIQESRPWMYRDKARVPELDQIKNGYMIESLYVSCEGRLLKFCDYPYEDQEEYAMLQVDAINTDKNWLERLIALDIPDDQTEMLSDAKSLAYKITPKNGDRVTYIALWYSENEAMTPGTDSCIGYNLYQRNQETNQFEQIDGGEVDYDRAKAGYHSLADAISDVFKFAVDDSIERYVLELYAPGPKAIDPELESA